MENVKLLIGAIWLLWKVDRLAWRCLFPRKHKIQFALKRGVFCFRLLPKKSALSHAFYACESSINMLHMTRPRSKVEKETSKDRNILQYLLFVCHSNKNLCIAFRWKTIPVKESPAVSAYQRPKHTHTHTHNRISFQTEQNEFIRFITV